MSRFAMVFALVLVFSASAFAQADQMPEDMQKMMAEWAKWSTPGSEHQLLAKLAGDWKCTSKWWMAPDSEPMSSASDQKLEPIFGGRFIKIDTYSEWMGEPSHGIGYIGYDKFKAMYNMFWIDNMGTAMYIAYGTADAAGKTITLMGKMDDPMTGEKDKEAKYVYTFNDDGTFLFEIWDMAPGKAFKSVEMTYKKK